MTGTITVHGIEVDPSKLPPGLIQDPPRMSHNPVHCPKFVVNMFKAGSGKCRDCAHEWYQHEGVIDRQVADKFMQIWTHAQQKALNAAMEPMKTSADVREEKKRALISAAKLARSSGGGGSSNRSSTSGEWNIMGGQIASDEEEFKFYSKEEFLAISQKTAAQTPLVRSGSGSPFVSSGGSSNKAVKVVNLIDFEDDKAQKEGARKMEVIEQQITLMTGEISQKSLEIDKQKKTIDDLVQQLARFQTDQQSFEEKNLSSEGKVEKLRAKVKEQEALIEANKEEGRKVLDQLDLAMRDSEETVANLKRQLEKAEAKTAHVSELGKENDLLKLQSQEIHSKLSQEIEALKLQLGEARSLQSNAVELESEIKSLKHQLEEANSAAEDHRKVKADEANDIAEKQSRLIEEAQSLKLQLEKAQSQEKSRESELNAEIESLRFQLQESLALKTGQYKKSVAEIESLKLSFETTQSNLEKQIASLKQELELKTCQNSGQQQLSEAEKLVVETQLALKQQTSLVSELQARIDGHAAIEQLVLDQQDQIAQLSASKKGLEDTERECENDLKRTVEKQQSLIAQLSAKVAEFQDQIYDATEREKMAESKMSATLKQIEELEFKLQSVEGEREDVVNQLQSQLIRAKEECATLTRENKSLVTEVEHARTQLAELQTQIASAKVMQLRLKHLESELVSEKSARDEVSSKSDSLQAQIDSLTSELHILKSATSKAESENNVLSLQLQEAQSSLSSLSSQQEETQRLLISTQSELEYSKSELHASSDVVRSETSRLKAELETFTTKLEEARKEALRDSQTALNANSKLELSNKIIEDLKLKLTHAQQQLTDMKKNSSTANSVAKQSEQYLKAIQDVSFVMKTVTDKFISPNNSEANSRAVSIEEEGPEAVFQLERHVKAILRLVEAVSDKAKIIEKENEKLEEKVSEYEMLNSSLRERVNQSFMQRLVEPIISCRWSGPTAAERILEQSQGLPIRNRNGAEMSQVSGGPPRQVRNMGKD